MSEPRMPSPPNPDDIVARIDDVVNRAGDIFHKILNNLAAAALAEGVAIGVRDTTKAEEYNKVKQHAIENAVDEYKKALRQ